MKYSDDFWDFINSNIDKSPNALRLKYHSSGSLGFDVQFAIDQIQCRQKCNSKLPNFCSNKKIIFPTTLSSEQCTSETLAIFHTSLLTQGANLLDMTCGLGVDAIHSAAICSHVTAIDINPQVAAALRYNSEILNIDNLDVINEDSINYLINSDLFWDTIFIDPARRSDNNKRTFAFEDCEPNIIQNFDLIKSHCNQLIIKASPMLDLTMVVNSLDNISEIWILSIRNECKEILIKCSFAAEYDNILVHALDFDKYDSIKSFEYSWSSKYLEDIRYVNNIDEIKDKWLYEPNSSVMKCACWNRLLSVYPSLYKLHPNTHLFISDQYYPDFPGRISHVGAVYSPKARELKEIDGEYYNIVLRNYPVTMDIVKKQYKTKDGGNRFMYCFRYGKEKSAILLTE